MNACEFEQGTLRSAWHELVAATNALAEQHRGLSETLGRNTVNPLAAALTDLSSKHKAWVTEGRAAVKEHNDATARMHAASKAYRRAESESDALAQSLATAKVDPAASAKKAATQQERVRQR